MQNFLLEMLVSVEVTLFQPF